MGDIFIKSVHTGASITINHGQITTFTNTSQLSLGQDPGTHSFTVSLSVNTDYLGQYEICSQKNDVCDCPDHSGPYGCSR